MERKPGGKKAWSVLEKMFKMPGVFFRFDRLFQVITISTI